jgi:hypothetical protein
MTENHVYFNLFIRDRMLFELEQECLEVYIMLFKMLELLLKLSNNNDLVTITTINNNQSVLSFIITLL